jgi:hypothetical protein
LSTLSQQGVGGLLEARHVGETGDLGHPAVEPPIDVRQIMASLPRFFVPPEQFRLPVLKPVAPPPVAHRLAGAEHRLRQAGVLDLHADELGAVGVAVLVEPVGVDQAQRIIVRLLDDGTEESLFVGHGGAPRQIVALLF